MRKTSFLILGLVFCLFFSCKKKEDEVATKPSTTTTTPTVNYDTIFPLSYFPVYPGSYWTYNDGGTDSATGYFLYDYHTYLGSYPSPSMPRDTNYVPYFNGSPIYGYMKVMPNKQYNNKITLLDEKVGKTFTIVDAFGNQYMGGTTEACIVTGKFMDGSGDSVLTIASNMYYPNGASPSPVILQKYKCYYTYKKNIGLTNYYKVDTTINDTTVKRELVNYHINH